MILKHLGLWETRNHEPPFKTPGQAVELIYDQDYAHPPFDDYWIQ